MPSFPRLPSVIDMPGGTVQVVQVKDLVSDGQRCWGEWDESTRTITLSTRSSLSFRWKVFYHEVAHATLDDAGVSNLISSEMAELLCDAFATARHRERFGSG